MIFTVFEYYFKFLERSTQVPSATDIEFLAPEDKSFNPSIQVSIWNFYNLIRENDSI